MNNTTVAILLLAAGSTVSMAQTEKPRGRLSRLPPYPADGVFSGRLQDRHVFRRSDGSLVVSYEAGGGRMEHSLVLSQHMSATVSSSCRAETGGVFSYHYVVTNHQRTPMMLDRLFFTLPQDGTGGDASLQPVTPGWRWEAERRYGPTGEGVTWAPLERQIAGGGRSERLSVRTRRLPGLVMVHFEAERSLSVPWESLPASVRKEIEAMERGGYGSKMSIVAGPKFAPGTSAVVIARDYLQQIEYMARTSQVDAGSPFLAQVRDELEQYLDLVQSRGGDLEADDLMPAFALTVRPSSEPEVMICEALKSSLAAVR